MINNKIKKIMTNLSYLKKISKKREPEIKNNVKVNIQIQMILVNMRF
jgi:hypothetical protein